MVEVSAIVWPFAMASSCSRDNCSELRGHWSTTTEEY